LPKLGLVPLAAIDATQHRFTDKQDLAILIGPGLLVLLASRLIGRLAGVLNLVDLVGWRSRSAF